MRHRSTPGNLHGLPAFLTILVCALTPFSANASGLIPGSFLTASVNNVWGVAGGCGITSSGIIDVPTAQIQQDCEVDYTTTAGLPSTVVMKGGAQTGLNSISMYDSAYWTNLGAPDFTGGNWGSTASFASISGGQSHLIFAVENKDPLLAITFSMSSTLSLSGTMTYSGDRFSTDPNLLPWEGEEIGILSLNLNGAGSGCNLDLGTNQWQQAEQTTPGQYAFAQSCTAATNTVTIAPNGYATLILDLNAANKALASNIVTQLSGGDYGIDVDFSHTAALSNFQFLVNGAAADPSAIDIVSGTLRMTSAGIQDTAVPEPGTLVLFGGGLIAFGFLKRRERPRPSCQ